MKKGPPPNPQVDALIEQGRARQEVNQICRTEIDEVVAQLVAKFPGHIKQISEILEGQAQRLQREHDRQQLERRRHHVADLREEFRQSWEKYINTSGEVRQAMRALTSGVESCVAELERAPDPQQAIAGAAATAVSLRAVAEQHRVVADRIDAQAAALEKTAGLANQLLEAAPRA